MSDVIVSSVTRSARVARRGSSEPKPAVDRRGSRMADRVFRAVLLGLMLLWFAFPPGQPPGGDTSVTTTVDLQHRAGPAL